MIKGLARLEYRGYDSCGIAAIREGKFFFKKRSGKIQHLKKDLRGVINQKLSLGILHTRWATHGRPNRANAHPHLDCKGQIALAHNGIIENHAELERELRKQGHRFISETDTEVVVHLIESFYQKSRDLKQALLAAIKKLEGSFSLAVISQAEPEKIIAARKGSPLIIGLGDSENFLASDIPALLPFASKVIYLKEEQAALLTKEKVEVFDFSGQAAALDVEDVEIKQEEAEKGKYEHFMIKEIFEQPKVLAKILSAYAPAEKIHFAGLNFSDQELKNLDRIYIAACGTAYHAGYVAKYFIQKHCDIDIEIDTSSEFRYRKIRFQKNSLLIAISQSGETADTLAAVREAKAKGVKILSICNVLGSSLVKESDSLISTLAGPEIGVASTKAYTAQVFSLYLFGLYLGRIREALKEKKIKSILEDLKKIPSQQQAILNESQTIKKIAGHFSKYGSFLFLGRGINYPSALEGALKLKEISYIPAEGYPAGEMKHGPIALIDEYRAVVCIAPRDDLHEKMLSNMQEAKARKGKILAILNAGDKEAGALSTSAIYIPRSSNQDLSPFLVAVCTQLFAYYVARKRKCEIDQPRNLAKSVTVE